jgi:hypothetical protein
MTLTLHGVRLETVSTMSAVRREACGYGLRCWNAMPVNINDGARPAPIVGSPAPLPEKSPGLPGGCHHV